MKHPTFIMPTRELHIMQACARVQKNGITKQAAADELGMSTRNFYRRYNRWLADGEAGLAHGNRGRQGNHRYSDEFKARVLTIVKNDLQGCNAVHATEMLCEEYDIHIHSNKLRRWIRGSASPPPKTCYTYTSYKQRRPRREEYGGLLQGDGSFHRWLGPDYPSCCLLAMIDDATGGIYAQFDTEERAQTMICVLRRWVERHGIPHTLYFDRRNAYVPSDTNHPYIPAVCDRLGIKIINVPFSASERQSRTIISDIARSPPKGIDAQRYRDNT